MDIKRIDNYTDPRFSREVLLQHGAFVIDEKYPCSFKIISENAAQAEYHDYSGIDPIIEQFRFFAEHINVFYDNKGNVIAEYDPVELKTISLDEIQPSQFYADEDKVNAVKEFIRSGDDIIVPVMFDGRINRYISLDGHTRMYYAFLQGYKNIRIFESETNEYIFSFADEAIKRGVRKVSDITMLSHEEYEIKWNKFCDDFFGRNSENK